MSYNKKVWKSGDRITKEALNNMENGIEAAHQNSGGSGTSYDDTAIKTDINTIKTDLGTETLTTTAKNVKGAVNEVAAQYKDIAKKVENVGQPTQEQINNAINKAIEDGKITGTGGINSTAKTLLQTILQNAVYTSNQSTNITSLISALGSNESGGGDTPTVKTYTITNNLTHCSNSNTSTSVNENSNYVATITPTNDYTLTAATVNITMGGTDITSTAYNNGTINISSVTGNVVITISAVEEQSQYTVNVDISMKNSKTTTWFSDGGDTPMEQMVKAFAISNDIFDKDTEIQATIIPKSTSYGNFRFGCMSDDKCYYGVSWRPKGDSYFTGNKEYIGTYTVKAGYKLIICGWADTSSITSLVVKAKA